MPRPQQKTQARLQAGEPTIRIANHRTAKWVVQEPSGVELNAPKRVEMRALMAQVAASATG